jgi:hypothetical protein
MDIVLRDRRLLCRPPGDACGGQARAGLVEPFDLILLVVIGDLVQQGVTQSDYSLTS